MAMRLASASETREKVMRVPSGQKFYETVCGAIHLFPSARRLTIVRSKVWSQSENVECDFMHGRVA